MAGAEGGRFDVLSIGEASRILRISALRFLPKVAQDVVGEWRQDVQNMLDDKGEPRTVVEVQRMKRELAACERIEARLKEGRRRLWHYTDAADEIKRGRSADQGGV